ncbi:uncharacterized protein SAPINGB_P003081 [Magnusiomyces paraingens]|uniref:Exoribonuclease phosphorolytic domain-containing protein n=1 Tax=Magnusiomyces paraingens TaxID=2606893 RepID=A0A5E8BRN3_9ASCO|nr:uncharacterized protein SAPINGB_P003081 [Saprochaete ingens]VVT51393.1 unnamed protein product [Saprochaete ingens]
MSDFPLPSIQTSILTQVDGSCEWSQNTTTVITSVSGPIEARTRDEIPTAATVDLIVRPQIGLSTTREHLMEEKIQNAFSSIIFKVLNPRALIQVVVQVIEAGELPKYNVLELSAAINSLSISLIDAGIPLFSIACAAPAAVIEKKDEPPQIIIHPTSQKLKEASSWHIIVYEIKENNPTRLVLCESTGEFTKDQLYKVLELSAEAAAKSFQFIKAATAEKLKRDFKWKN